VFNLPETSATAWSTVPTWRACERCDELFPAAPGQEQCGDCDSQEPPWLGERCEAAHPEDRSACEGDPDAVRVIDHIGDELRGCVHHASVVLASVEGSRVCPGSVEGAAVEAFTRARLREPFVFDPVGPWPAPHHLGWGER
jgi:hypothetical protein